MSQLAQPSTDSEAFRADLSDFLARHDPGKAPRDAGERLQWQRDWATLLVEAGYAAPAWPREWGGMDLPLDKQVVYHEEFAKVRRPSHPAPGIFVLGPTIIQYGTDEQRRRFLIPGLRGDILWAQGFSEPQAGSDLPSLRTRAQRDGDSYLVTGQKTWITNAPIADWLFTLVRTGTVESRQGGISYLLIDLSSPGVVVRPIRDMTGRKSFGEIFFDHVRVPAENLVGEENGGWAIARTSLGHERSTAGVAGMMRYRRIVDELYALARARGRSSGQADRRRLAQVEIDLQVLRWNQLRSLAAVLDRGEPGPASSVARLMLT
jgi:alkylation response protein AidB-like acyl-CoA dehydrogenase